MLPIVMSGGAGTRLWPMSRERYPKQFCDFLGESLQVKTTKRLARWGSPWTLTVDSLRMITERAYKDVGLGVEHIIYEPFAKNTAPAVALLCKYFEFEEKQNEVLGVFPADHLILKEQEFVHAIELAEELAQKNQVATLGIRPHFPATGYGYIEADSGRVLGTKAGLNGFSALGFHEKPNLLKAQEYIKEGNFFWNAGIFVFKVSLMIDLFKKYLPELWGTMSLLKRDLSNLEEIYEALPSISIDYGIMEKSACITVVPCDIGWSDVGSWDEVANVFDGNASNSTVKLYEANSDRNFVYSGKKKLVALVDVNDLVVVDTEDALLICKREETQKVKSVVAKMSANQEMSVKEHLFDIRPWGYYRVLEDETDYKLKKIVVKPGERLSYQSHEKREERWVLVRGEAQVTLEGIVHNLRAGDQIHIPKQAKHRIQNTGTRVVEFIEVQTGTYFGEDDIVRYEDDYGRSK